MSQNPAKPYYYRISAFPKTRPTACSAARGWCGRSTTTIGGADTINGGSGSDIVDRRRRHRHHQRRRRRRQGCRRQRAFRLRADHRQRRADAAQIDHGPWPSTSAAATRCPATPAPTSCSAAAGGDHDLTATTPTASSGAGDVADIVVGDNGELHYLNGLRRQRRCRPIRLEDHRRRATSFAAMPVRHHPRRRRPATRSTAMRPCRGATARISSSATTAVWSFINGYVGADADPLTIDLIEADRPCGLRGDDTIYGNDGNDILIGGAGGDNVSGDAGLDIILGDQGTVRTRQRQDRLPCPGSGNAGRRFPDRRR